jgi:carboxypeptidase Q
LDGRDWDYQGARAAGEHGVLVWQLDLLRCGMQNLPRRFLALTFALFTGAGFAQAPPDTQTNPSSSVLQRRTMHFLDPGNGAWTADQIATMSRIRDAAVSDDYALMELRHLTNNIGPRLSGSAQAVEYVAGEMRALGATVTLEKTTVPHWVRGVETGALVGWKGMTPKTTHKIVLTALGGSVATPAAGITAPVVVVPSFDAFKQLPEGAAKGKIVLFNHPFDKQLAAQGLGGEAYGQAVAYRGMGPSVAGSAGAVAVLVRSVGGADYRLPHTGATFYDPSVPKIPAAAVTAEDAELMADLAAQGPVQMHLTLTPETMPKVASYNVIADWKGSTHPEQVVIVSGHLDSWDLGTGAIDDGAGIVVSMQVIHLMQKLGLHPQRTIRFIAWMDEESGGEGAETYATDHAAELTDHVGALESDLGCDHPTGITFAGAPELTEWLRPVAHQLEPIEASMVTQGADVGEDIASVVSKGVPGFTAAQDSRYYFNYHHTAADTFDKVDSRHLGENAAVMAVTAYALAEASAPAPRSAPAPAQ